MKNIYRLKVGLIFIVGLAIGISLTYIPSWTEDLKEKEKVACKPWFDIPKEIQKSLLDKHVSISAGESQGSGCLIKPGY